MLYRTDEKTIHNTFDVLKMNFWKMGSTTTFNSSHRLKHLYKDFYFKNNNVRSSQWQTSLFLLHFSLQKSAKLIWLVFRNLNLND